MKIPLPISWSPALSRKCKDTIAPQPASTLRAPTPTCQAEGETKVLSHWPLWIEQENRADVDQWWNAMQEVSWAFCRIQTHSCNFPPPFKIFFLNSSFSHANADQLTRHDCEHLQLGFNDRYPRVEKNKQNNSYGKGRLAAKYAPASSLHFRSVGRPYYPLFNLKPNT